MASVRSLQVKLVDLGSAQTVSKLGTLVDRVGHIEYSCKISLPLVLNDFSFSFLLFNTFVLEIFLQSNF